MLSSSQCYIFQRKSPFLSVFLLIYHLAFHHPVEVGISNQDVILVLAAFGRSSEDYRGSTAVQNVHSVSHLRSGPSEAHESSVSNDKLPTPPVPEERVPKLLD